MTAPIPDWTKDDTQLYKQRAQVKSKFYYIFWALATTSVLLGQLYVGTGYRLYARSLMRIFDAIEVEVKGYGKGYNSDSDKFY
jgi:hypothetical protein